MSMLIHDKKYRMHIFYNITENDENKKDTKDSTAQLIQDVYDVHRHF